MADKAPKKESTIPDVPEDAETEGDPYLNQLDSSMEDLMAEEPTGFDIPAPEAESEAGASVAPPPKPEPTVVMSHEGLEQAATIPLEVRVVVGDKQTTLAELLELKAGSVMELNKGLDTAVDLMVQDKVVARGELVEVDGRLGVRIIRVFEETS